MVLFTFPPHTNDDIDYLYKNGIRNIRIDIPDYDDAPGLAASKTTVLYAIAKGMNVTWGVTSNTVITSGNIGAFGTGIESAAAWAEANGVYEFQVGNEESYHKDDDTILDADIVAFIKAEATACQSIFTNGNISYSFGMYALNNAWDGVAKGDIDFMCLNVYKGTIEATAWQDDIDKLVSDYGPDCYITEFGLNSGDIDSYSADESIQSTGLTGMINYIIGAGITRANYFAYRVGDMGAVKGTTKNHRKIWLDSLVKGNYTLR